MKYTKWIVCSLTLAIVACSGGGSGKSDGSSVGASSSSSSASSSSSSSSSGFSTGTSLESNPSWANLKQKNPLELSEEELKIAYWGYALDQYQGKLEPADVTAQNLQKFYQLIEKSDYRTPALGIETALSHAGVKRYVSVEEDGAMDRVTIDSEDACFGDVGGLTIQGTFTAGVGSATVDYSECLGIGDVAMTGRSVISGGPSEKPDYPEFTGTHFFESMNVARISNQSTLSGFATWDADYIKSGEFYEQSKVWNSRATYDRVVSSNEEIIYRTEKVTDRLKNEETYEGSLALGEIGSVSFVWLRVTNSGDYLAPISQLIFSGADGSSGIIHFFRILTSECYSIQMAMVLRTWANIIYPDMNC